LRDTRYITKPEMWPPNSPDLYLVSYKIWAAIQQRV